MSCIEVYVVKDKDGKPIITGLSYNEVWTRWWAEETDCNYVSQPGFQKSAEAKGYTVEPMLLCPKEPSEEMIRAFKQASSDPDDGWNDQVRYGYKAMTQPKG